MRIVLNEPLKVALGRRVDGEKLSQRDQRALAKHDKAEVERLLSAVPRAMVRRMTGLTQAQLELAERRHGVPIGGATVDMFALVPALLSALSDDVEVAAGDSPALERLRGYKADMAELELAQKRGNLVSVIEIREKLSGIAAIIRTSGEAMERAGGPAVGVAFGEMIDELDAAVNRWYPEEDETANGQENEDA